MDFNFESKDAIQAAGFDGFISVAELQATNCKDVPKQRGVYLVLRLQGEPPAFLPVSVGGHFKGREPTVFVDALTKKWVPNVPVIYIGKAGSETGTQTLRSRLRSYMQFGLGKPVRHWGGRYIWQLKNAGVLVACWKATPNIEPAWIESELIQDFKRQYQQLPFANLRN